MLIDSIDKLVKKGYLKDINENIAAGTKLTVIQRKIQEKFGDEIKYNILYAYSKRHYGRMMVEQEGEIDSITSSIREQMLIIRGRINELQGELKKKYKDNFDIRMKIENLLNTYIASYIKLGEHITKFYSGRFEISIVERTLNDIVEKISDIVLRNTDSTKMSDVIDELKGCVSNYIRDRQIEIDRRSKQ